MDYVSEDRSVQVDRRIRGIVSNRRNFIMLSEERMASALPKNSAHSEPKKVGGSGQDRCLQSIRNCGTEKQRTAELVSLPLSMSFNTHSSPAYKRYRGRGGRGV